VVAVAIGTVVSASVDSVNGRMVRIRHGSGYDSYYLHLSAFAQGIRGGARVDQGQTIGLVGSTGLATGPHLHYGLQKNGTWIR
jgi:murein DD-endopeptidase MepM/ murein hydrolase activator NlpD